MLARLWWKEGRTLAPIAATVGLAALALQLFLNAYGGSQVHNGLFLALGLGWAILYALVTATASFAGERETRMLGLLDALPVDRSTLWIGKATFALTSSLVLAFVLASMGEAGSGPGLRLWGNIGIGPEDLILLLFESVAWGLLWSSLCRTAIAAGIGAVVSLGVVATMAPLGLPDHALSAWALPIRLLLLVGAAGASWLILTSEGRPRAAFGPITIRLPAQSAPLPGLGTVATGRPARPRRTILPTPGFYRLAWQTVREGLGTWLLTLGLGVGTVVPGFLFFRADGTNALVMLGLVVMGILILGVSVFGLENAAGTRSFLDHQAIPPGTAWAAKVVPWLGGLVVFMLVIGGSAVLSEAVVRGGGLPPLPGWEDLAGFLVLACGVLDAFGVGLIAGMMFRRRVTAALVGLLGVIAVVVPQVVILAPILAPLWAAVVGPLALLGISRCWAGDWVGDRGGVRRWARLAGLVAVPSLVVPLIYAGGRAFGIADIGPQGFGPITVTTAESPAAREVQNLAKIIGPRFISRDDQDRLARQGWAGASAVVQNDWEVSKSLVPAVRALALAPGAIDFGPDRTVPGDVGNNLDWSISGVPSRLLMVDAIERRARGDFAGAWDNILAQILLDDRLAVGARSPSEYRWALLQVESAVRQGVAWASDPKVPLAAIEAARASLPGVQAIPSADNAFRHEADRIERRLNRPTEAWVDETFTGQEQPDLIVAVNRIYTAWVVAPSWERERTRRIVRLATAQTLVDARTDRALRLTSPMSLVQGGSLLRTPLVDRVMGPLLIGTSDRDQSQAVRRMLDLFLALRAWQLTHDGHSPETLAELFGGDATQVPIDPLVYGRQPFGYRLDDEDPADPGRRTRILYSVGPDSQDQRGRRPNRQVGFEAQSYGAFEDIVFPLPPEPPAPKAPEAPAAAPGGLPDPFAPPPATPRP